jgi:hypothetical protein
MRCDKCNIRNRPGEYCLICWKKKEPDYRVLSVDISHNTTNHTFTAGSTMTIDWSTWSDDTDWYITTTGYTR